MITDLKGRTAVVTGAASGLGASMALAFANEGMQLVLADVEADGLDRFVDEVESQFPDVQISTMVVDVRDPEAVDRLADLAFEGFGAVHVLCNNAGVAKSARAWDLTLGDWKWVLDVDLMGVVHGVRSFVPRMIASGEPGQIVNTGSMAGLLPMPNLGVYAAAKAGVIAFSECLQMDLDAEEHPIGVSVLCPGFIQTRITDSDRNRPTELGATAVRKASRTTSGVSPSMTADEVAAHVVDAITTGCFWIVTHQDYREVIVERAQGIGTDAALIVPPVW